MKIIDAHSHLWWKQEAVVDGQTIKALPNGRAEFFGEERQMLPPFMIDGRNTAEVFLSNMDYAQVAAAVVVQEVIDGNQDAYLAEVQRRYPGRFFCCALCDLDRMSAVAETSPGGEGENGRPAVENGYGAMDAGRLAAENGCGEGENGRAEAGLSNAAGLPGVAIPGHRMKKPLNTAANIAFFKRLEKEGRILSMCLADDALQISQFKEVIQECPGLRVAIGHFGMVTGAHWREQVALAAAPNVFIEAGGITWLYNSEFYPFPSAVRSIREAADAVGIDKLMWGSDYPRTITAITYRMSYDFVLKSQELTLEEKEKFLGGNAQKFYGFRDLPDLPYIKNMSE